MVHGVFPQNSDGSSFCGGGGGVDVWCSFDTFKIEFSPKYENKLRIFDKIFFGNVTQHCIGKCSKLLGK